MRPAVFENSKRPKLRDVTIFDIPVREYMEALSARLNESVNGDGGD